MTDQQLRLGLKRATTARPSAERPSAERPSAERAASEEANFQQLYASMSSSVFQFAARRLTPEHAKDIVHDTFEVVWRKRRHLPVDPEAWPPWVIGIARNKIRQEAARQQRRLFAPWSTGHSSTTDKVVVQGVADTVLDSLSSRDVYRRLTDGERELFDLAHLRTLSPRDGAAVLGISVSAYTTRVSRLRTRIVSLTTDPAHPDG